MYSNSLLRVLKEYVCQCCGVCIGVPWLVVELKVARLCVVTAVANPLVCAATADSQMPTEDVGRGIKRKAESQKEDAAKGTRMEMEQDISLPELLLEQVPAASSIAASRWFWARAGRPWWVGVWFRKVQASLWQQCIHTDAGSVVEP